MINDFISVNVFVQICTNLLTEIKSFIISLIYLPTGKRKN